MSRKSKAISQAFLNPCCGAMKLNLKIMGVKKTKKQNSCVMAIKKVLTVQLKVTSHLLAVLFRSTLTSIHRTRSLVGCLVTVRSEFE